MQRREEKGNNKRRLVKQGKEEKEWKGMSEEKTNEDKISEATEMKRKQSKIDIKKERK